MRDKRLSCDERKEAIVRAVLPVFARKGFANTTTKQLAEAAGVSEALIYKHFPSKESLYSEIQSFGCKGCDPDLQKILSLTPSTSTLVAIIYYIMRANIVGRHGQELMCTETRHRMILNSCLEDGSFTRFLFHNRFAEHLSRIVECMEAAIQAGDMTACPVSKPNLLLFAHHLATMIATMHLPKTPVVEYAASREELIDQAMWFSLRGLGIKEDVIQKLYKPAALAAFFET